MRFPITEHVCRTSRHTSFYLSCGAPDAPPIVFVHGFRGDHHGLEPIAAHLPGLRVIAPDLPGFGASDALPLASIEAYADHLIALVAELAPGAPARLSQ